MTEYSIQAFVLKIIWNSVEILDDIFQKIGKKFNINYICWKKKLYKFITYRYLYVYKKEKYGCKNISNYLDSFHIKHIR